ncbi:MAG: radical SAM protein [Promethearchaeota archaeon]
MVRLDTGAMLEKLKKGTGLPQEEILPVLECDNKTFITLMKVSWEVSRHFFGWNLHCSAPDIMAYKVPEFRIVTKNIFKPLSVTGSRCALMCDHCEGRILNHMIPTTKPRDLLRESAKLHRKGCRGVLISGGSMKDGSVPLKNFESVIKTIKSKYGFLVAVHTGLVDREMATALARAQVDLALIDVIGDNETINEIYHLDKDVKDFEESLKYLKKAGLSIAPHVIVGLHHGRIKGELKSLDMIAKIRPQSVVIIAFKPIKGTKMDNIAPAKPIQIAKIIVASRFMMPNVPIILGCARPTGLHKIKTDVISIRSGITGIAFPTETGLNYAKSLGLERVYSPLCCAFLIDQY